MTAWPGSGTPQPNALYENLDGRISANVTEFPGTTDALGWRIICKAGDIDNDGWQYFAIINGFVRSLQNVSCDQILSVTEPDIRRYNGADINRDGVVDFEDLFLFQGRWQRGE